MTAPLPRYTARLRRQARSRDAPAGEPMSTATTNPTTMAPVSERIDIIDSLRAAALCGVIVYNIVAMVGGFLGAQLLASAGPADLASAATVIVLVQGKARTCFALLFGIGFGILMDRANARGQQFTAFYLQRMAILLAIGLFNLSFLFFGDILVLYALLGMAMLPFRGWSNRALLLAGLALIVVPPLAAGAYEAMSGAPLPNLAGMTPAQVDALMPASLPAYQGHDFAAYVAANWAYYIDLYRAETSATLVYNASVLGLFLLGLWTARTGVLADVERFRPFLRRVAWWCIPLGLALSVLQGTRRMGIPLAGALHGAVTAAYAGVSIAGFGYIALACLLLTRQARPLQAALAPLGRMALTGYLGSNAIGAFVFYGWGLGLMTHFSAAGLFAFGLAIFLASCVASAAWMRAFRFGPAEWLWRSLTYGRAALMRAPAAAPASAASA